MFKSEQGNEIIRIFAMLRRFGSDKNATPLHLFIQSRVQR